MSEKLTLVPFDQILQLARATHKSKLFGYNTAEEALMVMHMAVADGFHPMKGPGRYHIIKGKISKKAESMLGDFKSNGGVVKWTKMTDTHVEGTFTCKDGSSITIDWDMKRADNAGLAGGQMYTKYPRAMLRSRVISEAIRGIDPDCTGGMYDPEEVESFTPTPEVAVTPPPTAKPEATDVEDAEIVDNTPEPAKKQYKKTNTEINKDVKKAKSDKEKSILPPADDADFCGFSEKQFNAALKVSDSQGYPSLTEAMLQMGYDPCDVSFDPLSKDEGGGKKFLDECIFAKPWGSGLPEFGDSHPQEPSPPTDEAVPPVDEHEEEIDLDEDDPFKEGM